MNRKNIAVLTRCPKCALDTTDFTIEELRSHQRFHQHMADAPRSIPHQSPARRLEDFPRYDVSGHLWI